MARSLRDIKEPVFAPILGMVIGRVDRVTLNVTVLGNRNGFQLF